MAAHTLRLPLSQGLGLSLRLRLRLHLRVCLCLCLCPSLLEICAASRRPLQQPRELGRGRRGDGHRSAARWVSEAHARAGQKQPLAAAEAGSGFGSGCGSGCGCGCIALGLLFVFCRVCFCSSSSSSSSPSLSSCPSTNFHSSTSSSSSSSSSRSRTSSRSGRVAAPIEVQIVAHYRAAQPSAVQPQLVPSARDWRQLHQRQGPGLGAGREGQGRQKGLGMRAADFAG